MSRMSRLTERGGSAKERDRERERVGSCGVSDCETDRENCECESQVVTMYGS